MKPVMTKEIAMKIIKSGSVWDVEGKDYWVSDCEQYTNDGRLSYFRAVEIGTEYENEDDLSFEEGVYVAFPRIEEDDPQYNPEPNEWSDEYDISAAEVWERTPC